MEARGCGEEKRCKSEKNLLDTSSKRFTIEGA
jgi:hypothetical protein